MIPTHPAPPGRRASLRTLPAPPSDQEVVVLVRRGQPSAFDTLVTR